MKSLESTYKPLCLKSYLTICLNPNAPLSKTAHENSALSIKIFKMRILEPDRLICILLCNALGDHLKHIQSTIRAIAESSGFSSDSTIVNPIRRESSLIRAPGRTETHNLFPSTSVAVDQSGAERRVPYAPIASAQTTSSISVSASNP